MRSAFEVIATRVRSLAPGPRLISPAAHSRRDRSQISRRKPAATARNRSACPKIRKSSAVPFRRSSRPRRSSTVRSSRKPMSTSGWRFFRSPTAARSPPTRIDDVAPASASQPDRRNAANPGGQGRQDRRQTVGHRQDVDARRPKRETNAGAARCLSSSSNGSTIKSLRRQIEGEIAWQRLQRDKIEDAVSVGDDEVKAVLAKLERVQGHRGISRRRDLPLVHSGDAGADPRQCQQDPRAAAQGASFAGYARQYSEASTAAVGGDLGWVRPEQLPAPLADALRECPRERSATQSRCPAAFRSSPSRTRARS